MADGNVTIKFAAEHYQMLQAMQQQQKEVDKLKAKLAGLADQPAKQAASMDMVIGKWFTLSKAIDLGMMAMRGVADEFERVRNLQIAGGVAQATAGVAQRQFNIALGVGSDVGFAGAEKRLLDMAEKTGMPVTNLLQGGTNAMSARGTMEASRVLDAMEVLATFNPSATLDEFSEMSGAIVNFMKSPAWAAGLKEGERLSAQEAMGVLQVGQVTSQTVDMGLYAKNVGSTQMQMIELGDTLRESAALLGTTSQLAVDTRGAFSSTAMLQIGSKLKELTAAIPELQGEQVGTLERGRWLVSGDQRAEAMRQKLLGVTDEAARAAGARGGEEVGGEVKAKQAIIGFLTPGSRFWTELEKQFAMTPEAADADIAAAKLSAEQATLQLQQATNITERGKGREEAVQMAMEPGELRASKAMELYKQAPGFGMIPLAADMNFSIRRLLQGAEPAAAEMLQGALPGGGTLAGGKWTPEFDASPEDIAGLRKSGYDDASIKWFVKIHEALLDLNKSINAGNKQPEIKIEVKGPPEKSPQVKVEQRAAPQRTVEQLSGTGGGLFGN